MVSKPPGLLIKDSWPFGSKPDLSWENFIMTPVSPFISPTESQKILIGEWYLNAGVDYCLVGNYRKAYELFMIGAKVYKNVRCISWIGICFLSYGGGIKQDLRKAKIALERAVENGDDLASKILSRLYEKERDKGRAAWYRGITTK